MSDASVLQDDSMTDATVVSSIVVINGAILGFHAESKII